MADGRNKFLQKAFCHLKKAESRHESKVFEVRTVDDRVDQWEVTFFYHDEEAERAGFDQVLLLFQFCKSDMQIPPKVSVVRPRITGIGLFGGALCFDRKKMWVEYHTDMEAFLLTIRLHLIYQMQARLEDPCSTASSNSTSSSSSSSSSSSLFDPMVASYSPQERANGFNHIMRTHWDWKLVDIADDGSAVELKLEEQQEQNKQEADRMLHHAMGHLHNKNLSSALQGFTEAMYLNGNLGELYYRRATVFKKLNALHLARKDLEQGLKKRPLFPGTKALLEEVLRLIVENTTPRTIHVSAVKLRGLGPGALQFKSLEEAVAVARDADVIAISKGSYCASQILVAPDVTIRSHPEGASVKITTEDDTSSLLEIWSQRAVLKGLTIEHGNRGSCVKIANGHCTLLQCALQSTEENTMGLLVEGPESKACMESCSVVGNEFAAVTRQKAECTLTRCTCESTNGIIAETGAVVNVHKSVIHGPLVYTDFTGGRVEDNIISESKSLGLSFQGQTREITVTRNLVEKNKSVGLLACRGAQVLVYDNVFSGNARTQIEVQGKTSIRIQNNHIKNGLVNGILITAQGTDTVLERNLIVGHKNAGISISEGSQAQIVKNVIQSCGASGLFFTGGSTGTVLQNTIFQCCIAGLELEGSCAPILKGNTIRDNLVGIQVSPSACPTLWKDTVLKGNRVDVYRTKAYVPGDADGEATVDDGARMHPHRARKRIRAKPPKGRKQKQESRSVAGRSGTSPESTRAPTATRKRRGLDLDVIKQPNESLRRMTRQQQHGTIGGRYPKRQRLQAK
uniref:Right handed beta helix domain-containing protein n=2 Tax=Eutreptiella gymnastica TaxID=73025 RepID=A0A7S1JC48_9EUGL|mmetsp:Transcript_84207/g.147949  ORF Transcript_84207/g.147949 Transcript_84207/m.147949 type:complete len:797 (+) Transcript_84207:55-2445(+)